MGLTTACLYTLGFVTEEQGVQPLPGERREGCDMDERARLMADFPLSARAGAEIFEDYDRHFEEGLALVSGGIGARYGVSWRGPAGQDRCARTRRTARVMTGGSRSLASRRTADGAGRAGRAARDALTSVAAAGAGAGSA